LAPSPAPGDCRFPGGNSEPPSLRIAFKVKGMAAMGLSGTRAAGATARQRPAVADRQRFVRSLRDLCACARRGCRTVRAWMKAATAAIRPYFTRSAAKRPTVLSETR